MLLKIRIIEQPGTVLQHLLEARAWLVPQCCLDNLGVIEKLISKFRLAFAAFRPRQMLAYPLHCGKWIHFTTFGFVRLGFGSFTSRGGSCTMKLRMPRLSQ